MGRFSRFQLMERSESEIIAFFESSNANLLTFMDISGILEKNKTYWSLPNATSVNDFLKFLKGHKILDEIKIKMPQGQTTRYIFGYVSTFQIALSLNKKSYLSHFSALFIHGITNNVTKHIYTNVEQSKKWWVDADDTDEDMEQKNIDLAFSRAMRRTNQIAQFELNGAKYNVYLLNGKNHDLAGVKNISFENKQLPSTDIERTLIDIVVRPDYSGGVGEVLDAYVEAKGKFSVNKLLATLKKMKHRYPYHQLIGFYLEMAGYDEKLLQLLDQFEIKNNFYLTYQMKDKEFSKRWRVYYPKGFTRNL